MATDTNQKLVSEVEIEDEDEDPIEERRRIFGEESSDSDSDEQNPKDLNKEKDASDTDSVGNCKDEDEDEFLIVLQAVRERKKFEAEINRPMLKDKLSQTGWKLRENFMKKSHSVIDDRDRIDVFNLDPNLMSGSGSGNKPGVTVDGRVSDNSDDVIILEY
jgi:hypothetical protein